MTAERDSIHHQQLARRARRIAAQHDDAVVARRLREEAIKHDRLAKQLARDELRIAAAKPRATRFEAWWRGILERF